MSPEQVKMVMLDGTITRVPSGQVDELVKYANWKVLEEMKLAEIRKLPAAKIIENSDQMTKKKLLEQL